MNFFEIIDGDEEINVCLDRKDHMHIYIGNSRNIYSENVCDLNYSIKIVVEAILKHKNEIDNLFLRIKGTLYI